MNYGLLIQKKYPAFLYVLYSRTFYTIHAENLDFYLLFPHEHSARVLIVSSEAAGPVRLPSSERARCPHNNAPQQLSSLTTRRSSTHTLFTLPSFPRN